MRPLFTLFLISVLIADPLMVGAMPTPTPVEHPQHYGGTLLNENDALLKFQANPEAKQQTENLISQQNQAELTGARNSVTLGQNLVMGQERAAQMVTLLKDEQFRVALEKVTSRGKVILEENQSLRNPATVILGAASLWLGSTIRLFKSDSIQITSHIEARAQRGEFSLESPLLNSKVLFRPDQGLNLNLNRSIASINSTAELNYMSRTNSVSTQLRHPITPNLNFSIGSSQLPELNNQTDGQAKIEYQIHF
jgi:hypothetical protein